MMAGAGAFCLAQHRDISVPTLAHTTSITRTDSQCKE